MSRSPEKAPGLSPTWSGDELRFFNSLDDRERRRYIKQRATGSNWLNKEQAAGYLGVCKNTIDNWRAEGLLAFSSIPGFRCVRIHRDDLDALLRRHREGGAA